jgi:hypothetical protein
MTVQYTKCWHNENGKLHREDGPAAKHGDGRLCWYINGKRHREDGPAIEAADGGQFWYQHGKLHRTDGPAVTHFDGDQEWWVNGELHREDGPALVAGDTYGWYLQTMELTEEEFAAKVLDKETALLWKMSGYYWPFDFGQTNDNHN